MKEKKLGEGFFFSNVHTYFTLLKIILKIKQPFFHRCGITFLEDIFECPEVGKKNK